MIIKNNLFEVIIGTFVLFSAVYFFLFSFNKSGISTEGTYQVIAKFEDVDGIGVGSDIKIAGVKIGSVAAQEIDEEIDDPDDQTKATYDEELDEYDEINPNDVAD